MHNNDSDIFYTAFRGTFTSLLSWQQLDEFWDVVRRQADAGWYIYAIGAPAPIQPASADEVIKFLAEINTLLHNEHYEDYCGIVYTNHKETPTLVKIFDPNHLGGSCGISNNPPLPGWVLSRIPPQALETKRPLSADRQRWWQALWS